MRKSATWAACAAWLVPEQGACWTVVHAGPGLARYEATRGCPCPRQESQQYGASHRISSSPIRRCYKRHRLSQQPMAAHNGGGGGGGGVKRKRSSPYGLPLYEAAGPSSSPSRAASAAAAASATEAVDKVDSKRQAESAPLPSSETAAANAPPAAAAKTAAAVLLASSSRGKGDGTMTTSASLASVNSSGDMTKGGGAGAAAAAAAAAASPPPLPSLDSGDRAKTSGRWRARLTLAAVACLYGTNYTAIKFMGDFMETSSLLTLRFGLAGLALLPALRGVGRDVLLAGAEVGVYATLGYGAQAYAMRSLPASQLALVGCLAVLVVPFLDQVSGRRKAGIATISAAILACGGAALLQSGGIEPGATDGGVGLLPHVLALMQPFFFGFSTWRMEDAVTRHPGQALALTASQVVVVAVTSALLSVFSGGFPSGMPEALTNPGMNPWALAVLVWLGLVNTALVLFLETDALESVSASEATVIYSLEPLVGAGLASSALGEPFPSPLGASFVLGGCLCSSLAGSGTGANGDESDQQQRSD